MAQVCIWTRDIVSATYRYAIPLSYAHLVIFRTLNMNMDTDAADPDKFELGSQEVELS